MAAAKRRPQAKRMNTRQRVCADVSRRKAKQKRMGVLKKRCIIAGSAVAVAYGGFGVWWLSANDSVNKAQKVAHDSFWGMTASAGFKVQQVYLEGREHLSLEALKQAMAVSQGDPIMELSLDAMHERLMALPEVKRVAVRRTLPGELHVTVEERKPVALWQRAGKYGVIDDEGVVLNRDISQVPKTLLLVVGDDAPKHMKELMALMEAAPAMKPDVEAAVRVGERRWNIRMKQGMTVMLPEDGAVDAWKKFVTLAQADRLLSKAITSIDLRLEDRVFVTPASQNGEPKLYQASARET